jgi:4-aminobutyrate aminotransferase/(S)-3-amino-2-methylpropionate transaminase
MQRDAQPTLSPTTNADCWHAASRRGPRRGPPTRSAARADNAEVWDVEGKRYIDFAGGIAVLNTGHRHPQVIAAVKAQLDLYTHTCFQVLAYEPYVELAEKLNALAPGDFAKKTLLLSSGAEALENAVKIARAYTKRPGIIAFTGGYHGRTMFTLGLTGKVAPYKLGFGPFPGSVFHAQFPNTLYGISVDAAIASVESIFKNDIEAAQVAAIIIEPVQGEVALSRRPLMHHGKLCDSTASCSWPTRCRPASGAPAPSLPWSRWAWPPTS